MRTGVGAPRRPRPSRPSRPESRLSEGARLPPFPKPRFAYAYDLGVQLKALRRYRNTEPGRQIPGKATGRVLIATWNIANLGVQDRQDSDYALIAEIISWFDLVTVQEVNDDLAGILAIKAHLPKRYALLFSDASGNLERQAFLYDTRKVSLLEEVGRLAIPPSQLRQIKLPGTTTPFPGFDRGPYLATFEAGTFRFMLLSVHLFYGSPSAPDLERRTLETFAVAWWADHRRRDPRTYVTNIVPLGDFNLPKASVGDKIFDALSSRGLTIPRHTSQIGSAIASDSHYDQIAFFPGATQDHFTGAMNVFDFDGALFRDLWQSNTPKQFLAYTRFHISDHRPLWAEFRTT
jgi:endonuclease/exonuclease/phosphatase family metal-dependent hydrolase